MIRSLWRFNRFRIALIAGALTAIALSRADVVDAHSGPPFPIVTHRVVGPYDVSVWTDPDATNDGSSAGRFWVTVTPVGQPSSSPAALPPETIVTVTVVPANQGAAQTGQAMPVRGDASQRFVALRMDHEGRYSARVDVDGPLGRASADADVDATYDLRPSLVTVVVGVIPFVLIGFLWIKQLVRRKTRRSSAGTAGHPVI